MVRRRAQHDNGSVDQRGRVAAPSSPADSARARSTARGDAGANVRDGEEGPAAGRMDGAPASLRAQRNSGVVSYRRNAAAPPSLPHDQGSPPHKAAAPIARKGRARAERLSARRRSTSHRALAALSNLPVMLTAEALEQPERFIREFAASHQLPLRSAGAVVRTERYERDELLPLDHPDAWRLVRGRGDVNLGRRLRLPLAGLERLRNLILEMGTSLDGNRPEAWTPEQRAAWCLVPWRISAADLNEICAVAAVVAEGLAAPERALARHRSGLPLEDAEYRDAKQSAFDAPPVAPEDRQVVRLRLLNEIAFARPYDTEEWMVRWVFFRPGRRRHPHFTATVAWLRQALDFLAARAAETVRDAARQYRADFFRPIDPRTWPMANSQFDFWVYGYGEVADPVMEARVVEQARAFPREAIDHVRVALAGDAKGLYQALREAGTAALRWPWVLRVLDGWRGALEGGRRPDREKAKDRIHGVSAALAHIAGSGPPENPDRAANMREAVVLLRAYFEAYLKNPSTPIPPRLLEIGQAAEEDLNARTIGDDRRARYARLDEAAIVAARRRVTSPKKALEIARDVVSAAFAVARSTIVRVTEGLGAEKS